MDFCSEYLLGSAKDLSDSSSTEEKESEIWRFLFGSSTSQTSIGVLGTEKFWKLIFGGFIFALGRLLYRRPSRANIFFLGISRVLGRLGPKSIVQSIIFKYTYMPIWWEPLGNQGEGVCFNPHYIGQGLGRFGHFTKIKIYF